LDADKMGASKDQGTTMDVIVLGGGLMGTASAYFLARRGARVRLIERNRIGTGATVASFGNIRRTGRHLSQLALAHRSLRLWGEAEKLLGRDVEFRATGHIRLIFDEESLADMRAYAEAARPWGLALEELGPTRYARAFLALVLTRSRRRSLRMTAAAIRG
jgi:sarcosine oxidase subunit beta